ncbi:MAG: hypothetical protein J1G02_04945 [Clostridiales bacterium]|nr:hypothetical protein [Clostridiales bacterium]
MKSLTKRLLAVLFAILTLLTAVCVTACSPYSGRYQEVSADELDNKTEQLQTRINQAVNSMLWHDMMPNYKTVYTLSEKTNYINDNFSTETKVKVTQYGYEGLKQTKVEYHSVQLINDTDFMLLGAKPILEETNCTVTFWYGDELENIYYELVMDGKKEQDILPYDYGKEELKKASNYDVLYQRYIKYDIDTAFTFDYKLFLDGENKVKIDSKADDGMEKWTILAYLIFDEYDTVYFKEEQEHNQTIRGNINRDYFSKSKLEITPSNKKISLPKFAKL